MADSGPVGEDPAPAVAAPGAAGDATTGVAGHDTVGTGSALAVGCSIVSALVILLGCLLLWLLS